MQIQKKGQLKQTELSTQQPTNWTLHDFLNYLTNSHPGFQSKIYYTELALISQYFLLIVRFTLQKLSMQRGFSFEINRMQVDDQYHIIQIKIRVKNILLKTKVLLIQMDRIIKVVFQNFFDKEKRFIKQQEFYFDHVQYLNPKISNSYKLKNLKELFLPQQKCQKCSSQLNYVFISRLFYSFFLNLQSFDLSQQSQNKSYRQHRLINVSDNLYFFNTHSKPQQAQNFIAALAVSENLIKITQFLDIKSISKLSMANQFIKRYFFTPEKIFYKSLYEHSFGRTGFEVDEFDWKKGLNKKRGQRLKFSKKKISSPNYMEGFVFRTH